MTTDTEKTLQEAAKGLAMMALQSKRYHDDMDFRDQVDTVLALTLAMDVQSENRTCVMCKRGAAEVKSWTVGKVPVGQDLCGECAGHYEQEPRDECSDPSSHEEKP